MRRREAFRAVGAGLIAAGASLAYVAWFMAGSTYTLPNGSYRALVEAPYLYVGKVKVQAVYVPEGSDLEVYEAARSPEETLTLLYLATGVSFKSPLCAYPGVPLTVEGEVRVEGEPSPSREVKVYLARRLVAEAVSDAEGRFKVNVTPPLDLPPSVYRLAVYVEPRGIASGAWASRNLKLVRVEGALRLKVPSLVVLPSPVAVEGFFTSPLPSAGGEVRVEVGGAVSVVRAVNGSFEAHVYLPIASSMTGLYEVKAFYSPDEPWNKEAEASVRVLVVNPLNLVLASLAAFLVVSAARRSRLRPRPFEEAKPLITEALKPRPKPRLAVFTGRRGEVVKAYREALERVEDRSGVYMEAYHTLREYLREVLGKLGPIGVFFARLTELAERALYAGLEPSEREVSEAEELKRRVVEG